MKHLALALAVACLLTAVPAAAQQPQPPSAQEQAQAKKMRTILESLHPLSGDVTLPAANAMLHLGKDFYYLPPDEARKVLVDAWGNPPRIADGVLGIVFPAGKTFLDDTWGAAITYEGSGYVTDKDAQSADYDALLKQLQSGEDEINAKRKQEGYPAQHLVGWAQPPFYDAASHSVVWAQNIAFDGQSDDSLNYDVRMLGRKGVLSLNMITAMSKLDETRTDAQKLARSADFSPGARYADFKTGDDTAGYGIAGLVAAGLGVVAVKKLGLLAILLVFAKKFLILIVAALAALGAKFRKLFGLKEKDKPDDAVLEATPSAEEIGPSPDPDPEPAPEPAA
ncbi:MAG: hypothetical protein QOH04_525 [Sphingomonadales bacterium]|jgi:uncharacterized membrane-anchored protein|nr:hypothetical protein [Sphingomonadales bacterium]